jgi:4a-hydroxytetrahydrobiopterin dehydratase
MEYITLNEKELDKIKVQLPEWQYIPDIPALYREFTFTHFLKAIEFMHKASLFIDTLNHHPEWTNVYNKIKITLYTHDVKNITTLDIQLAKYLTELYQKL